MSMALITWLILRASRWFLWLGFFVYSLHIFVYRESHLNSSATFFPPRSLPSSDWAWAPFSQASWN
jgi:hypothetical protein